LKTPKESVSTTKIDRSRDTSPESIRVHPRSPFGSPVAFRKRVSEASRASVAELSSGSRDAKARRPFGRLASRRAAHLARSQEKRSEETRAEFRAEVSHARARSCSTVERYGSGRRPGRRCYRVIAAASSASGKRRAWRKRTDSKANPRVIETEAIDTKLRNAIERADNK